MVLASFGQGSNAIKSAEQGAGLGLPIAKSLVDLHGGTFTLKSKLRVGTEVIIALPPERVMAALAPLIEPSPALQPKEPPVPIARRKGGAATSKACGRQDQRISAALPFPASPYVAVDNAPHMPSDRNR